MAPGMASVTVGFGCSGRPQLQRGGRSQGHTLTSIMLNMMLLLLYFQPIPQACGRPIRWRAPAYPSLCLTPK